MEQLHQVYWPNDYCNHLLYFFVQPHHLIVGMLILISIIAIVIVYMLFYLLYRARKSKNRQQLRQEYSEFISYLAICESVEELQAIMEEPEWKSKLTRWLSNSFARNVLVRELVTTVKNMSGTAASNAGWFYAYAGLDKDSLARLKKGSWHIKARAIRELAHLKQKQYIAQIYRHTNNRNEYVRNEARVAIVQLTGFEGLRFLDIITYPLTEWEQLCLLHELSLHPIKSFVSANRWLQSSNISVVEFCLNLIETYKLYDLYEDVVSCFTHPDKKIRKKAIEVVKEISRPDTPSLFAQRLDDEEEEVQKTIIEVLQQIGTENEIDVLTNYLHHPSDELKAGSALAIGKISAKGWSALEEKINPAVKPWNQLLPYLKHGAL
jgi:hypothetical protein